MPKRAKLSASAEDYLKAIYQLEVRDGAAANHELARQLNLSPPSVTGMLQRLTASGLALRHADHRVQLTTEGRRVARRTLRQHQILACYLTAVLGFSREDAHNEVERMVRASSDELIDRMAAAIGEPTSDPHSVPIPARECAAEPNVDSPAPPIYVGAATTHQQ